MFAKPCDPKLEAHGLGSPSTPPRIALFWLAAGLVVLMTSCSREMHLPEKIVDFPAEIAPGLAYTNYVERELISVHVARVDRTRQDIYVRTVHATKRVQGMTTMSNIVQTAKPSWGQPLAGINGDFYERTKPYNGDPRGLEILDGEITSVPGGYVSLWFDPQGRPHAASVLSLFQINWPGGLPMPLGLNEYRKTNAVVLYTPRFARSTGSTNGYELVLEQEGEGPWLPLRIGQVYRGRVVAVTTTNTPIASNTMVLSIGPALLDKVPLVTTGTVLRITAATFPDLKGMTWAIGGGPLLMQGGERLKIRTPSVEEAPTKYARKVPFERHPRTAFGWNDRYFFFVVADGRQMKISEGLNLAEMGKLLERLGCTDGINLDGGGSATFWCNGQTLNSPSDKRERDIANALMAFRRVQNAVDLPEKPPTEEATTKVN